MEHNGAFSQMFKAKCGCLWILGIESRRGWCCQSG